MTSTFSSELDDLRQKAANPRKGIETAAISQYFSFISMRQKAANPRKGIETPYLLKT